MHCHIYNGLSQLFPTILQKEKSNSRKSLMDTSCFPYTIDLFDLNKISFTECPTSILSMQGIQARIKLFSGALVLNYATVDRLLRDMDDNHIGKAVVQQINPPNKSCAKVMDDIVTQTSHIKMCLCTLKIQ